MSLLLATSDTHILCLQFYVDGEEEEQEDAESFCLSRNHNHLMIMMISQ